MDSGRGNACYLEAEEIMRILWLCNMAPAVVRQHLGNPAEGGLWLDHVLDGLMEEYSVCLRVLCLGGAAVSGEIHERLSYRIFTGSEPYTYSKALEDQFCQEIQTFAPDVIHIWGTEYAHTLAMANACQQKGMTEHTVVSIQGLCTFIAAHYNDGVPAAVQKFGSLRDVLRRDNLLQQQEKFTRRGELEAQALAKLPHVIGRTQWDCEATAQLNPNRVYHFCNETLRKSFYTGLWHYADCRKHSILAPNCYYPVKGFHYLLEAFAKIRERYPDATLCVPGRDLLHPEGKQRILQDGYRKYLAKRIRQLHLQDSVYFLGKLSAEEMKAAYQRTNVFALPSTMENSSNSLGEAMLLGVPCVAADVGGTGTLLHSPEEGIIYSAGDVAGLTQGILRVFAMEEKAEAMGLCAREHAKQTHDPKTNLETLYGIYQSLRKEE